MNVSEKTGKYETNNNNGGEPGAFVVLRNAYQDDGKEETSKAFLPSVTTDNALRYSADLAIILGASPLSDPHMRDAGDCEFVFMKVYSITSIRPISSHNLSQLPESPGQHPVHISLVCRWPLSTTGP